jgi:hypothetical protein
MLLLGLAIHLSLPQAVSANAFLNEHKDAPSERISAEEIQISLLEEIGGDLSAAAASRLGKLEDALRPIYATLPKNEHGKTDHATVRYALHRLFIGRHGWLIKGLDPAGSSWNTSSPAGILKDQVPAYIEELFEQRLGKGGLGLHELAVMAATIEHLIHQESAKRLGVAFKLHGFLPTMTMDVDDAEDVLDTYMAAYIFGDSLGNMSEASPKKIIANVQRSYGAWSETQDFVRGIQHNVTHAGQQDFDFATLATIVENIGQTFGGFQDTECQGMKRLLMNIEIPGTGRVRLTDFYKPDVHGAWHFEESVDYLRSLGALDETNPNEPLVVMVNYILSQSNCVASTSFYKVCCMNECESLLGHLEQHIAAPEASPMTIANLVRQLPSSSVMAPRNMSSTLLTRLDAIASGHGGTVPLHGRLFAQWMHHAYPHECPFPHVSGSINPMTPDEWMEEKNVRPHLESHEKLHYIDMGSAGLEIATNHTFASEAFDAAAEDWVPWTHDEELLVVRPALAQKAVAIGNRPSSRIAAIDSLIAVSLCSLGAFLLVRARKESSAVIDKSPMMTAKRHQRRILSGGV